MKQIFKDLFHIDGKVTPRVAFYVSILGWLLILFVWWLFPTMEWIDPLIVPTPINVVKSFGALITEKQLFYNMGYSISVNLLGYIQAILIAVPLGFTIALVPFFRHLISKQIEAIRFTPLPATTGIFMALFGIGLNVKVQFLGFGIFVYLLPAVVQRIDEFKTNDHLKALHQTMLTMNATTWQKLRYLYFPSVASRGFADIINLVAVSWTYIVIAELVNAKGGLGYLIYLATNRSSNIEQVYAVLILIIFIGFIQDKLLKKLDRKLFKFKYA